jgi:sortase A
MEALRRSLLLFALAACGTFHIGVAASPRHEQQHVAVPQIGKGPIGTPDQSLWSPNRVSAWRRALRESSTVPVAVLRISRIRLEAPVLPGSDENTLDRGVGHIEGTAQPVSDGNSGLAGHRDGFFRALKDIVAGDEIELDTLRGKDLYRVESTWVVAPDDVSVLAPTSTRALTLVTCYPFYYIGHAPQRFIVRAVRTGAGPLPLSAFTEPAVLAASVVVC